MLFRSRLRGAHVAGGWHVTGLIDRVLGQPGWLVLLVAGAVVFARAVMPALAGTARMPYPRFLAWNALGGVV